MSSPDQTDPTYAWVEATDRPVVVTDDTGRILALNDSFGELFTIDGSRLPTEPVEDLIVPSRFRSAYRAARERALSDGLSPAAGTINNFTAVRADGGEFSVELNISRPGSDPPQIATWIRDLTEDRTLVAQTLGRASLHNRTEELAGFGSWEWRPESAQLLWSDNMFRIYGLRPGEIVPSPEYLMAHSHPDDRARLEHARALVESTHRRPELRSRHVSPDGTVRDLVSTIVSVVESEDKLRRISGTVQDVTEQRQAERELGAHFAVSDALSNWERGAGGAPRLVRDLAEALEFELGVMWVPRGDVLAPWVIWQAPTLKTFASESALRSLRLGRDVGLAGSAWASAQPTRVGDLTDEAVESLRTTEALVGAHGALAVPAPHGDDVLAVLTFGSRWQAELTHRNMRSLLGIGYEIGHFLARRTGELSAPTLTPRELQVLQLSANRRARRQIAEDIGVSEATVKTHLEHIYHKLGVSDRASAVAEAIRQGLIH
jgi:PAS domain S-box-containing protein